LRGDHPAKPKHMIHYIRAARTETDIPGAPRRVRRAGRVTQCDTCDCGDGQGFWEGWGT